MSRFLSTAHSFADAADELRARAAAIEHASVGLGWRSPGAGTFREQLSSTTAQLVGCARELDAAAASVRRLAARASR